MENHTTIVIGPPGCGKGTIAEFAEENGYRLVSIGNLLRTYAPKSIMERIHAGEFAPDNLVHDLISEHTPPPEDQLRLFFDGAARTKEQARFLLTMLTNQYQHPICVVHMTIFEEVATHRMLLRKRGDDTPPVIKKRMRIYDEHAPAVLEYFKRQYRNSFYSLDANESQEIVRHQFASILEREKKRVGSTNHHYTNLTRSSLQEA